MKTKYIDFQFNWENELMRRNCPKDNVGQWLEEQAKGSAYRSQGFIGEVYKTKMEELEDGNHIYHITLKGNTISIPHQ